MVEVRQEDREAAERWGTGPVYSMEHLAQSFARHRVAAENAALERAAKVADRRDTGDMQREDMEARAIAAAIRALKGPSNAD